MAEKKSRGRDPKAKVKKHPGGRPTDYKKEYALIAFQMTLIGATDAELGAAFDVSEQTINAWKKLHPEFIESIKRGKTKADAVVAASLFKRANGFTAPDVHISTFEGEVIITPIEKYYPPDTGAAIFFLKNRRPAQFRDKPEVQVDVKVDNHVTVDTNQPPEQWGAAELEAELKRLGVTPITVRSPKPNVQSQSNGHRGTEAQSKPE